jgi:hypothetical protein
MIYIVQQDWYVVVILMMFTSHFVNFAHKQINNWLWGWPAERPLPGILKTRLTLKSQKKHTKSFTAAFKQQLEYELYFVPTINWLTITATITTILAERPGVAVMLYIRICKNLSSNLGWGTDDHHSLWINFRIIPRQATTASFQIDGGLCSYWQHRNMRNRTAMVLTVNWEVCRREMSERM